MCFHLDRCDILSVPKSKRKHYHALHGQMLKSVNSTHFLGVTLTSDTTWETYQITNKASRTLGSGKNPEDRLLFSKRQGLQVQGSCHTSPGICKLYLAPKQYQADQPPSLYSKRQHGGHHRDAAGYPMSTTC